MKILIVAFAVSSCVSGAVTTPGTSASVRASDYLYRVTIIDCRITVPQLATAFRIDEVTLLSAAHPFEGIQSFQLADDNGRSVAAHVVALVPEKDIAVLRLTASAGGVALPLAREEVAAQTPATIPTFDRDGQLEMNEAFVVRRAQVTLDGQDERRSLQLDGDIQAGDSGAPVVVDNSAVGIVFASTRGADAGWAVSLPEIEQVLNEVGAETVEFGCTE